jgi:hypothetical protein
MMRLMLLRFPHRQIDATLDQEDTQIYAKTRSDIQVGSVMEDPSSRADARSDKVFHLPIHAIGGAHLYFVRKVELIMSELHVRARPDSTPQGRVATPFWASSSGFLRTAEEICSDEMSLNHGAGRITQFEFCVNRLVSCDRAECQQRSRPAHCALLMHVLCYCVRGCLHHACTARTCKRQRACAHTIIIFSP